MIKRKIFLLFYSFLLISIWAACFIMKGMTDSYAAAMGMSFTFLSIYFLQKEYDFQLSTSDKVSILIFPFIYLIPLYITLYNNNSLPKFSLDVASLYQNLFYIHLVNPVLISLIILILGMTKMKDLRKPVNIYILTYVTLFYAYFLHPAWMSYWLGSQQSNFDTETPKSSGDRIPDNFPVDTTVTLSGFSFINSNLDTINLASSSGKYILLETWSENCFPCIKAMAEMPDFYETIQQDVDVFYLYENDKPSVRNKFDKIFSFKSIKDKSKILVDIDQELYNSLRMNGFPYFLLFDSRGRLIYHFRGFPGRDVLSTHILEHL